MFVPWKSIAPVFLESAVSAPTESLLTTPLNALHIELGARMVPFAGYSMPVQYPAGLMAEHHHTRNAAGLFDVSHMGQLRLVGPDAAAAFETLMPVDAIDLSTGAQTSLSSSMVPARRATSPTSRPRSAHAARSSPCPRWRCWRCKAHRP